MYRTRLFNLEAYFRAASEIIDDLLGPIEVPSPLVPWSAETDVVTAESSALKQRLKAIGEKRRLRSAR